MTAVGSAGFVLVANRLPVDLVPGEDGTTTWRRTPGGMVNALEPVLRARDGAWVGWDGSVDGTAEPQLVEGLRLHPVPFSQADVDDHWEGFANTTLWPLYHDAIHAPEFRRHFWHGHVEVNRRFAEATAAVAAPGATVWVQDYQLQLVPKMLRMLRPDLVIGFFLHIPFPPVELFLQLPWRTEVVEGLLGADLVGFQLPEGARNFLQLAARLTGHQATTRGVGVRSRPGVVRVGFRSVRVGAFPISVDVAALDAMTTDPGVRARARQIRHELGDPRTLLLGVDRLDYTKGLGVRLTALEELLRSGRLDPATTTVVQLTTPSRERVEAYARTREETERHVASINGELGTVTRTVVHHVHRTVPRAELVAFLLAADVMLVTALRDGMNLVAKEFVAARADLGGALVLSEFAGAATELAGAHLVNPHDVDGVADAVVAAATEPRRAARARMRGLHRQVRTHDLDGWAAGFLATLAESAPGPRPHDPGADSGAPGGAADGS
ncbi:trehalose-6-phosphate synthase [Rhodococcus aerolatus]